MTRVLAATAMLLMMAAPSLAQTATDSIDCSAFQKQPDGYLVTKITRIATPDMEVMLPQRMPIRRGQKAASVHGKNLADIIDQKCAGKGTR